ncbi:hypothetical protein GF412_00385 [Candidatus Micrarchaeota archaeon]|nr:hypothetical protein [Candidatus Micrarchaeota archaeon]MBD3417432.1 hypothetical protein [Candidatus Micrarchaeota archaeon]
MRALGHSIKLYRERAGFVLLFSLPFIIALLIPSLVSGPTYISLGAIFLRTGSIPEIDPFGFALMLGAYLVSMFLIAQSIVSITLLVKIKKTQTNPTTEVMNALKKYGMTIFLAYTLAAMLILVAQLLTFDLEIRTVLLPLLMLLISAVVFFVPQAMVIDNYRLGRALDASIATVGRKFADVVLWMLVGTLLLTLSELIFFLLPHPLGSYLVLLVNSVFVLPFLVIYQAHIYMKKYALAH